MAQSPKMMVKGTQLAASAATLYTVGASRSARVLQATLTNEDASAHTVDLYVVPSGEARGVQHYILKGKSISAGSSYVVSELVGHLLESGATIDGNADGASHISVLITGIEIT